MKKISVVTATRAEYGLLKNFIIALKKEANIEVEVVVTGAHLSEGYGSTYREIEKDGIIINKKIDILVDGTSSVAASKSMGLAIIGFAEYFDESKPDAVLLLGDRYEMLAVACAAMNSRVPIFHLHGGETTEGAIDEAIRHAITKMSYLHFTSTDAYRRRVIQLGEAPERVFNVGAVGVENVLKEPKLTKGELGNSIDMKLDSPYAVVTFHPVTLEGNVEAQCNELLKAVIAFPQYKFIITGANADDGGSMINSLFAEFASKHDNVYFTLSLGLKRYLSVLKYASFVLGNSSSGIIEVPSFGIPTINIGNRQKGRIQADSIINVGTDTKEIVDAINLAMSDDFKRIARRTVNPYGDGNTVSKTVSVIKDQLFNQRIDLAKKFYDIEF
ncbi:MAG: UDP-N-acetylglucosamine 2-epimerase [Phascolarctobacterium sp.]|nr:UDP-N-acetylglucosamine 2-epimerase [Phascolarctobacterium sp.]